MEEKGGITLGNVYVPQFPGWRVVRRSQDEVNIACASGATLLLTSASKSVTPVQSLRFEKVPLLIQKNRSGAEVYYHIVSSGTTIAVEGYIVADGATTMFFGQSPLGDRPSLSELERTLSESRTLV